MDPRLAELDFAVAYLDDILVRSKNVKNHEEQLASIFERIKQYGFKQGEKCELFMPEIKYLGQIINKNSC